MWCREPSRLCPLPLLLILHAPGRNTTCGLARFARAEPFDACGAFTRPDDLVNAIVVVGRGGCAFTDKAMNVQAADGVGMGACSFSPALPCARRCTTRSHCNCSCVRTFGGVQWL
jgi:hypothetical protein